MKLWIALGASVALFACSSDDGSAGGSAGQAGSSSGGAGGTSGAGGGGQAGSGGAGGSGGSAGAGGGTPEVRFVGRTDRSDPGVVKMAWSGSAIGFRFAGSDASVRLDDQAGFFTLVVDGQEQPRLETAPGEQSYVVASGLPDGEHEVWLHRRTEASFGNTSFLGVELGSGTLLPPSPEAPRRIEIIGDSITCGYGNEGPDQYCNFSADTENHYLTYGAIAARNLNAELVTVAWSGKGVIYNYGDDKTDPLPALYDRTLPYDATSAWDFAWQPDVVVLNLGTNDFSTDGDPSQAEFAGAYEAFLAHIRGKYPNAWIVCMVPTLLSGPDLAAAESYIQIAVDAREGAGDSKLSVYTKSVTQDGWGCDWHPSAKTHAAMGADLTSELQTLLGW